MKKSFVALLAGLLATVLAATLAGPPVAASAVDERAVGAGAKSAKVPSGQKLVTVQGNNPRSRLSGTWGIYKGPADMSWTGYENARPKQQAKLQWFVDQPKAQWFGAWIPVKDIAARTRRYIELSQAGDPDALVQMTIFRMDPWYRASRTKKPTKKQVRQYKKWIRASAAAIGDTRTALFLQPDATFLRTVPDFKLSSGLLRFAAKEYGKLPNTLVYLETGGWDWPHPGQGGVDEAVRLLTAQGMKFADGVVTNTTHYNKTEWDVQRIADIVRAFERKGIHGLKGVVNTSSNGKGFEFGKYTRKDPDHAFVCGKKLKGTCVTFGIPPTTDVANPRWGLPAKTRRLARQYVDAYMWVGRPWLRRQNSPFMPKRTIRMSNTTPHR